MFAFDSILGSQFTNKNSSSDYNDVLLDKTDSCDCTLSGKCLISTEGFVTTELCNKYSSVWKKPGVLIQILFTGNKTFSSSIIFELDKLRHTRVSNKTSSYQNYNSVLDINVDFYICTSRGNNYASSRGLIPTA